MILKYTSLKITQNPNLYTTTPRSLVSIQRFDFFSHFLKNHQNPHLNKYIIALYTQGRRFLISIKW